MRQAWGYKAYFAKASRYIKKILPKNARQENKKECVRSFDLLGGGNE
jgi:hypothetical protein